MRFFLILFILIMMFCIYNDNQRFINYKQNEQIEFNTQRLISDKQNNQIKLNNRQREMLIAQNNDVGDYYNSHEVLKWQNPKQIKVFILSKTGNEYIFKEALEIYNNAFHNIIKFVAVDSPQSADIEIRYVEQLPKPYWGYTNWKWKMINDTKYITKADIKIALKRNDGSYLSNRQYLLTTLHELGHALGIPHSENPNDIMFPQIDKCYRKNDFSNRDINTLLKTYE